MSEFSGGNLLTVNDIIDKFGENMISNDDKVFNAERINLVSMTYLRQIFQRILKRMVIINEKGKFHHKKVGQNIKKLCTSLQKN